MSARPSERLYHLLPAVYRQRDFHHGEPLRALLGVMEAELRAIEDDVEGLYENWFVETCEEWVVPYLADLLGVRGLEDAQSAVVSQRARVANTLGYRRRKGTLAALETLVRDVTGWPARAVEYFELLAATQHLEHPRPGKGGLFDLRAVRDPRPLVGPFATAPHNADLRSIAAGEGRHNLGNLGLFLWRLGSFGLSGCPAKEIAAGCYTFHPLGLDIPLFTRPRPEGEIARAAETGLPGPIRPSAFAADSAFYGPGRSLEIVKDGGPVPAADIDVGDLDGWPRPPSGRVAVDVTRGRLAFATDEEPREGVEVSYHYGFGAPLGGGPYDRHAGLSDLRGFDWRTRLAKAGSMRTLQAARDAWHDFVGEWHEARPPRGLVRIADSATYGGALELDLPAGSTLAIEAEDGVRPCLRLVGNLKIVGPADGRAQLILDGLLIEGGLHLAGGIDLYFRHSTLLAAEAIRAEAGSNVEVTLDHSIVDGAVRLPGEARHLTVRDSIVGLPAAEGSTAIGALDGQAGPPATFERATVFGSVFVRQVARASEAIFTGKVVAERRQTGCVRFCYLPAGSVTPRRFRCVPAESEPRFTSVEYGDPAFAQLAADCPKEIRTGAEDGSELGAFHGLRQAQRTSNLQRALDEYLPLGLEAGVFFVT